MRNPDADLRYIDLLPSYTLYTHLRHTEPDELTRRLRPPRTRRFMALNDLISEVQRSGDSFGIDDATEHSTVDQTISLMNDTNGEVKNLAVKA